MKPETRLLRAVDPEVCGPAKRTVLEGIAKRNGAGPELVDQLIADGRLVKYSDKRQAKWGLPRGRAGQRGFGALAYLLAAIALVGALAGLYALVDGRGYARGQAEKQADWDAANRSAEALATARRVAVGRELLAAEKGRLAAEDKARIADDNWKEAQRENRRSGKPLVYCPGAGDRPQSDPALAGGTPSGPGIRIPGAGAAPDRGGDGGGVRFAWEFVRQYDGAWTGLRGEPVHGAAAGAEAAAGSGPASPYTADEVLDVHGENARRCSADRRELDTLIRKIQDADRAWRGAQPPR